MGGLTSEEATELQRMIDEKRWPVPVGHPYQIVFDLNRETRVPFADVAPLNRHERRKMLRKGK